MKREAAKNFVVAWQRSCHATGAVCLGGVA